MCFEIVGNGNAHLYIQKMAGVRNVAALDYISLNLQVVKKIIETRLNDFEKFTA